MAGARGVTRIGYEEKGQRAVRSTDVYVHREGAKEEAVCAECHSLFRNKRWYAAGSTAPPGRGATKVHALCPACQRVKDGNPAGVVTFGGDYLVEHEAEIVNAIRNIEGKTRAKNPLARIMELGREGKTVTVATTDDKLAQKLGKDIFKAYSGRLEFHWSKEESFVRVNWSR
jgi:NMD protein affecting ribosome stability and mRNA decay